MAVKFQGGRAVPTKDQGRERARAELTGMVQKIDAAMRAASTATSLKPVVKSNVEGYLRTARGNIIGAIQSLDFNEDF